MFPRAAPCSDFVFLNLEIVYKEEMVFISKFHYSAITKKDSVNKKKLFLFMFFLTNNSISVANWRQCRVCQEVVFVLALDWL